MNTYILHLVIFCELLVVAAGAYLFFTLIKNKHLGYDKNIRTALTIALVGCASIVVCISARWLFLFAPNEQLATTFQQLNTSYIGTVFWLGIGIGLVCIISAITHMISLIVHRDEANYLPQSSLKANAELDLFFAQAPMPLIILNKKQRIIKVNNALSRLLQQNTRLIERKPLKKFVYESDIAKLENLALSKINDCDVNTSIELRIIIENSEIMWVRICPRLLQAQDNNKYMLLWLHDISESKKLIQLTNFHSHFDPLTKYHNREALENYLEDKYKNPKHSIVLIYIDVDQLKVVNDTCGRTAGDMLIQDMANIVKKIGRDCDFFARMGGDEFAIVKAEGTIDEAKSIAERMRSAAEDFTFTWNNQKYRQSISIGVALSSKALNCVIDIVGAADSACFEAKNKGKNRVVIYSEMLESLQNSRRDMMWVSRLQKAVQYGSFVLYFQPIRKLNGDPEHIHYEFLIRYKDESGEHILPQHFIPAVERFGLSEQVDLWVLTTALDYLDKHPEHTQKLSCCSINLTSQSIANPRIRSAILQVVASYNFPLEKICFEITESSAIHNINEAQEFIQELKTLGCHLALDDFGTGFSSFAYLKHLEVDYLKIDGSFVRDIIDDKFDRAMVNSINYIGKEMQISIIAEYAHSDRILSLLTKMEIDYAQGNAIAKPMPLKMLQTYYH